ncbi:MAG: type II toxin-antitoxin system VapC family toxin [Halovenus sp.]
MRLFVDTNIFVANLVDEPGRSQAATDLLDSDHDLHTSLLNLMELRTVLVKKKQHE